MSNNPGGFSWTWRGRLGMILLAIWCLISGLIGIGVPLQALAPILNWMLAAAGVLLLLGV
jgi:hypothetical protein